MIRGFFYRIIMRIAHRYNWHYAPPIHPDGDTMLWCKWCGFQQVIFRSAKSGAGRIGQAVAQKIDRPSKQ